MGNGDTDKAAIDTTCASCGAPIAVAIDGASMADRRGVDGSSLRRPKSPINRNYELAAFVRERAGTFTIDGLAAAVRDRFGRARSPSASAIHRYLQRKRGEGPKTST